MYQMVAAFEVPAENHQNFIDAALENQRDALANEPGTLRFELIRDREHPDRFYLNEAYQDEAAFEVHREGAYFDRFCDLVDRFATRPITLLTGTCIEDTAPGLQKRKRTALALAMTSRVWKRLVLPLALVFLVSATVLVVLYQRADANRREELEGEAGKAMLQVIAVSLLGSVVLMIIKDFEERRKEWLTKRDLRRKAWLAERDLLRVSLTDGLMTLYSRAKAVRRRLRASVRVDAGHGVIGTRTYDGLLQEISDIQLGLERYKRQAEGGERAGLLLGSVVTALESMEKYLGKLVSEYEKAPRSAGISIPIKDVPRLGDFIGRYAGSRFRSHFVDQYDEAAKTVANEREKDLRRARRAE
jgi:autoinducer 2-degrading protein